MGNQEMGKWEESTLHFTQQTADVLLLQSSNTMRKSMSIHALIETSSLPDSWQSQCPSMHSLRQHLCLTVGKVNVHPCTH